MDFPRILLLLVALLVAVPAHAEVDLTGPGSSSVPTELRCGDPHPCQQVLPGATRFERVLDKPYAVGFDPDGAPVGWVVLSTTVVDIKGYSGKPMATLLGLSPDGVITGGKVVHHSEPILLVGIPESELDAFVNAYVGVKVGTKVVLGGAAEEGELSVDIVSGATVTVLAENRTILDSARLLAEDVGVLAPTLETPGHFVTDQEPWTWARMMKEDALGHLMVTHEQMGVAGGDTAFIDLYFGLAAAPHIGIPLLGERTWRFMTEKLAEDEQLVIVLGNGTSSFRGSGFVRGGIFDRIRLEQGLSVVMFRDLDYKRIGQPPVEDAPHFSEAALFIARGGRLDPGRAFDFVFLGSAFDLQGGFSREFRTFKQGWRAPKRVYALDGPDPESLVWRQAWSARKGMVALLTLYLLLVTGVFVFRNAVTASMPRLKKLHVAVLTISFVGLGLGLSYQPSITQLLTLVGSTLGEWRWSLFLSEPFLFVSWIWIAGVTLVWGRGVFCGWVCPYGAMNELAFKLGRVLKLPEFELPDAVHDKARWIRYGVFVGLVGAFLVSPELGERLAEIEPFKSTFFVRPWAREWFLFAWWLVLAVVAFAWYRPFCRYLCPLGAALALPSSFRLSGPYRRDFCSTGCRICPRGCEPRAIRKDGSIDPRECLNCWECEANYNDDEVCPPLVQIRRRGEKARKAAAANAGPGPGASGVAVLCLALGAANVGSAAEVLVGTDAPTVAEAIALAADGDVVVLPEGTWAGHVTLDKPITLTSRGGVLDGGDAGTVLRISAPGAVVSGLSVRGSGTDRAGPDSCIYVEPGATGAQLVDNTLWDCTFGIWIHTTHGVAVERNVVRGRTDIVNTSDRGNGIHLFDAEELRIVGNRVEGARDGVYVSATEHSLIAENVVEDLRYGIHYMFSFDNTVRDNICRRNTSGIALMQSHRLQILDNVASDNERHGILFRDVQYTAIEGNVVERNGEGMFFFSSLDNTIRHNRFVANVIGARIWAGTERNVVDGNAFIGNRQQVYYVSASDQSWGEGDGEGNRWSDYLGWDQDGDGRGDRPYRVDSFHASLLYRYPSAALLLRSPALEILGRLQERLPALRVPTIFEEHPAMTDPTETD